MARTLILRLSFIIAQFVPAFLVAFAQTVAPTIALAANVSSSEPVRVDLRLMGADLTDEMVHSWLRETPFQGSTPLIVAEIDAPIGIDHRFEEAIENHLFEVLRANPKLPLQLVHCSICRQWAAISSPKRTIIGRAIEQKELNDQFRKYPHLHALSLHFDVVANDLVLWAEVYETAPPQKIVWSKRFSGATSARSVLQEPTKLVSIAEARAEQRRLLEGRDSLQAVTRFPIRTFRPKNDLASTGLPPLIFLEQSFEAAIAPAKTQRVGLGIGLTSIQGTLQGWSFGASYMTLLGRREPSLSQPDLYFRAGVTYLRLEGPGSAVFSESQLDIPRMLSRDEEPRASMTAFQIGVEARVKYRFGLAAFIEHVPVLNQSSLIATQRVLVPFHSIGFAGVLLW